MLIQPLQDLTELQPRFLGFQPSEESLEYLTPLVTENHQLLTEAGWPLRLVPPDKWHVTILWFKLLFRSERATLWSHAQSVLRRGAWSDPDFKWRGLSVWHNWKEPELVALAARKFPAVEVWGLEPWLTDPICKQGRIERLESYKPHITMMRFRKEQMGRPGVRNWKDEWRKLQPQLKPIDPERIRFDRLHLYLSDFSQRPHRYVHEHTANLPRKLRRDEAQLDFRFEN